VPRIFDNISDESRLITTLRKTLELSYKADFCVGYFNLRGWRLIDALIDKWPGRRSLLPPPVGMQRLPQDEMQARLSLTPEESIDHSQARRLTQRMAQEFRTQLAFSAPTNADEAGLRRLSKQLRARKVVVKLYLRHPLHAKLYMLHRHDPNNPVTGFLGSNLTMSGLSYQGELNVDVLEHDACRKLEGWFNDRWCDNFCLDISDELADIIDSSWAREAEIPPYHIYLKMAYHLSQEARAGLAEFEIPRSSGTSSSTSRRPRSRSPRTTSTSAAACSWATSSASARRSWRRRLPASSRTILASAHSSSVRRTSYACGNPMWTNTACAPASSRSARPSRNCRTSRPASASS
jgi:hypothetical protein